MAGPKKETKETKAADAPVAAAPAVAGAATGTDVAVAAPQALAAMQQQQMEDAGAGFEEATANSFAIPFLQILQSGSPQVKRSEGQYIAGAAEGMLYNTVTGDIYAAEEIIDQASGEVSGGVIVVPCHFSQRFIEWQKRETGGGFVAEHPPTTPLAQQTKKDDKNRDVLPNGNVLVDTRNHYCMLVVGDRVFPILITFSSTQVKKSRNWMSKMQGIQVKVGAKFVPAPMASRMYRLVTVPEKNDQGSWMGWKISLVGEVQDPAVYAAAMDFRKAILAGTAKAAQPGEELLDPQATDGASVDA